MIKFKQKSSDNLGDLVRAYRKAAPYINSTYALIASIAFFGVIGWWFDGKFLTKPLFFIIGLFTGLFTGFYQFYKLLKKLEE
jgi:F0F1-type ATP synthase assembly protein I